MDVYNMLNMLNAAAQSVSLLGTQHSEQLCKVVETATEEGSFSSLFLLEKSFHSPLDLVPAKTEECINCSAEFPSIFVDDFPRGLSCQAREGLVFFPPFSTLSVCSVASFERSLPKV